MRKGVVQLYIKNNEVIFSLAWNIIFSDNWKVLVLKFLEIKNMAFLSQKVDGNMIITDYWKVLVLTFSEMGNMVFSWAKKLTDIWYLLITGEFLFWTFRGWGIRFFFEPRSWWKYDIYWLLKSCCFNLFGSGKYGLSLSQKNDGNMIFTNYWKVLVLNFTVMRNTVFFGVKKLMERLYLLVTEKVLFWTFRWWEIRSSFQPKS